MKKGIIKISILYPNGDGKTFDIDYYCDKHIPMVKTLLGEAVKGTSVYKGIGGAPGSAAPYAAVGHLYFETVTDFQNSFGPNAEKIMSDLPNYTDIQPVVQISEVQ